MDITLSVTEFSNEIQKMRYPTYKSEDAYIARFEYVTKFAPDLRKGSSARKVVTKITKRLFPTLTEAIEFADETGNESIMKGAVMAIKAATPPKAVRNMTACKEQVHYSALAAVRVIEGLEQIARMYRSRNSEYIEIRREARKLQRRIRNAAVAAAKIASNVKD
jgi:hypothetical protein